MVRLTRSKVTANEAFEVLHVGNNKRKRNEPNKPGKKAKNVDEQRSESSVTNLIESITTSVLNITPPEKEPVPDTDIDITEEDGESPVFEDNKNELESDLNNSDISFIDEGGEQDELEMDDSDPDDIEGVEVEEVDSPPKKRGRGKAVNFIFGSTLKTPKHFKELHFTKSCGMNAVFKQKILIIMVM